MSFTAFPVLASLLSSAGLLAAPIGLQVCGKGAEQCEAKARLVAALFVVLQLLLRLRLGSGWPAGCTRRLQVCVWYRNEGLGQGLKLCMG